MQELEQEMKRLNLWQKEPPAWVNYFDEKILISGQHFAQWLQYVFVPNHLQRSMADAPIKDRKMLVPAALKFFGDDVRKGKLLQILIEIDSLL